MYSYTAPRDFGTLSLGSYPHAILAILLLSAIGWYAIMTEVLAEQGMNLALVWGPLGVFFFILLAMGSHYYLTIAIPNARRKAENDQELYKVHVQNIEKMDVHLSGIRTTCDKIQETQNRIATLNEKMDSRLENANHDLAHLKAHAITARA